MTLWLVPLPAGEPRRLGNIEATAGAIFADGRVVFSDYGTAADFEKGEANWFVADKDGSNPRKLVSFPGEPARSDGLNPTAGKFSSLRNDWAIASSSNSKRMGPGFASSGSSARMSVASRGLRMRSACYMEPGILRNSPTSGRFPCGSGFSAIRETNSTHKRAAALFVALSESRW